MRDAHFGISRRAFLGRSALVTGGAALSLTALGRLVARSARAAAGRDLHGVGYGPLAPVKPSNAGDIAAAGFPELAVFPIVALPHGFHYRAFSIIGGTLADGHPVPVNHDGMAVFAHPATRASSALSATKRIGRRPDRNPSAVPPKRGTTPSAVAATSRSTTTSVGTGSSKTTSA
jgi:secreted PhoX family phosphatase